MNAPQRSKNVQCTCTCIHVCLHFARVNPSACNFISHNANDCKLDMIVLNCRGYSSLYINRSEVHCCLMKTICLCIWYCMCWWICSSSVLLCRFCYTPAPIIRWLCDCVNLKNKMNDSWINNKYMCACACCEAFWAARRYLATKRHRISNCFVRIGSCLSN